MADLMTGAPLAALEAAVCVRDGVPVLRGVHLRVEPGEVLLVTGSNGAGKSTLLRVLAGLLPLVAGAGQVLGHVLPGPAAPVRRAVALVGHETPCYEDLTVRANLRFHAGAVGRPQRAGDRAAAEVGLGGVLDRPYGRLSAGQRRRCGLAVGMLRRSPLLLLDEPHASLDADGRALVDGVIGSTVAGGGAVVLVSHELDSVRSIADREVRLVDGILAGPKSSKTNVY
jgi:ABC-2 type transport system ATP-binding protein